MDRDWTALIMPGKNHHLLQCLHDTLGDNRIAKRGKTILLHCVIIISRLADFVIGSVLGTLLEKVRDHVSHRLGRYMPRPFERIKFTLLCSFIELLKNRLRQAKRFRFKLVANAIKRLIESQNLGNAIQFLWHLAQ